MCQSTKLSKFNSESGAIFIDYFLLVLSLVVFSLAAMTNFGNKLNEELDDIGGTLTSMSGVETSSGSIPGNGGPNGGGDGGAPNSGPNHGENPPQTAPF